jgi:hypothetical protein
MGAGVIPGDDSRVCSCPTDRIYSQSEICDYCREVAFFDDPGYAEWMGFVLVGGKWQPMTQVQSRDALVVSSDGGKAHRRPTRD